MAVPTQEVPRPVVPRLGRRVVVGVLPIAVLAVLFAVFLARDPLDGFRSAPPTARATAERVVFDDDPFVVQLRLRNAGAQPFTISQVIVNDAYWQHTVGDRRLRGSSRQRWRSRTRGRRVRRWRSPS